MQNSKTYFEYIDLAKGIGILLTIIGHGSLNNFGINVFHMPLFFFLSGITFTPPVHNEINTFILKKVNRIFIPYVAFSILSSIVEIIIDPLQPAVSFNGPLWFLQTLFVAVIIYSILHLTLSQKKLQICCFLIPIVVYSVLEYTNIASIIPFGLIRAFEATFFIHLGFCCKKYMSLGRIKSLIICAVSICIFAIGLYISIKLYDVSGATFINARAYTYNLPLALVTASAAIFSVITISKLIGKMPFINWFGNNSLVVLCVHFPVQERINKICFYCFEHYNLSIIYKIAVALVGYSITVLFCVLAILLCKKYLPRLSGYANLIPIMPGKCI